MNFSLSLVLLLASAGLSGCAGIPETQNDALAQQQASVGKRNCKVADIPRTGSAILRTDCSASEVQVVDPRDLIDSKRVAVPDPLGSRGK